MDTKRRKTEASASTAEVGTADDGPQWDNLPLLSQVQPRRFKCAGLDTPCCLLYTQRGMPSHLSPETLRHLKELKGLQVPLADLATIPAAEGKSLMGLKKFLNLEEYFLMTCFRDELCGDPGPANDKSFQVQGLQGKKRLTPEAFMALQATYQTDAFQAISDEIPSYSSSSRVGKSVARTIKWLDTCVQWRRAHVDDQKVDKSLMFAVIQGGAFRDWRLRCLAGMVAQPVDGFMLGGLGSGESPAVRHGIIETLVERLPAGLPRGISGLGSPEDVLECVARGLDIISSSYPSVVTDMSCASTFALNPDLGSDNEVERSAGQEHVQFNDKVSIRDLCFARDTAPLLPGCACYTCAKHTRAYIHHLLNVHEMLAEILLKIHNTHHYLEFFKVIRDRVEAGPEKFETFHRSFVNRLHGKPLDTSSRTSAT